MRRSLGLAGHDLDGAIVVLDVNGLIYNPLVSSCSLNRLMNLKHLGVGKPRVLVGVEVAEVTLLQISAFHISTPPSSLTAWKLQQKRHIRAPWRRRVLPAHA